MFSHVLFPMDFSAAANQLLECLGTFRPLGIEEIVLLHVTDVREAVNPCGFDSSYYERHDNFARRELERGRQRVEAMGYACRTVQFHDVPGKGIVHTARDEKCDLILMGSHGKTLARELLLGSISEYTVRHAPVPVLLVKMRVVEEMGRTVCTFACEHVLRKVLLPTDFSECAKQVPEHARGLRSAGTEEFVVMHVQDVRKLKPHLAARMDEFNRIDTQRLTALRRDVEADGFRVRTRLSEGVPFQEILRVADEEDVGMITIGTHGRSAIGEVLLGSVSQEVIRRARQPVLVVPCAKLGFFAYPREKV